jgi:hypothetical protein
LSPLIFSNPVALATNAAGSGKLFFDSQLATVGTDIFVATEVQTPTTYIPWTKMSSDGGVTWVDVPATAPPGNVDSYRMFAENSRNTVGLVLDERSNATQDSVFYTDYNSTTKAFNPLTHVVDFTRDHFASTFPYSPDALDAVYDETHKTADIVYADQPGANSRTRFITFDPVGKTVTPAVNVNDSPAGQRWNPHVAVDSLGTAYMVWHDTRTSPTNPAQKFQPFVSMTPNGSSFAKNKALTKTLLDLTGGPENHYNRSQGGRGSNFTLWTVDGVNGPLEDIKVSEALNDGTDFLSGPSSVPSGSTGQWYAGASGPSVPATLNVTFPSGIVFESVIPDPSTTCTTPAVGSSGIISCKTKTVMSGGLTESVTGKVTAAAGTTVTLSSTLSLAGCDVSPKDNMNTDAVAVK